MTITEDGFTELLSMFGEELTHIPHAGYKSDADDFWHSDAGWDNASSQTITGFIEDIERHKELIGAGLSEDSEAVVRTDFTGTEEGDKIVIGSEDWVVLSISKYRIQGREFANLLGVRPNGD